MGQYMEDAYGRPIYGGHSFRTGGAVWLASLRLELSRIQMHGRWQSSIIEHRVREVPLWRMSELIKEKSSPNLTARICPPAIAKEIERIEGLVEELSERMDMDIKKER